MIFGNLNLFGMYYLKFDLFVKDLENEKHGYPLSSANLIFTVILSFISMIFIEIMRRISNHQITYKPKSLWN